MSGARRTLHELALEELAARLPGVDFERALVRVDRALGGLVHELRSGEQRRHFLTDDRGVVEIAPQEDPALPLARELGGSELLAWRPGRRIVLARRAGGARRVLVGHPPAEAARAAARHRAAEEAAGRAGLRVPRLTGLDPALGALTLEEVPADRPEAADPARLGRRLAAFHALGEARGLPRLEAAARAAELARRAEERRPWAGPPPPGWEDALGALGAQLPLPLEERVGLVHGRLRTGRVRWTSEGPVLLGLQATALADAALDPGDLTAHWLRDQLLRGEPAGEERVREASFALVEGLGRARELGFWLRLRAFQAIRLLALALEDALVPRTRPVAPRLVEVAARCVRDLARSPGRDGPLRAAVP